ncbi:MAG: 50S ribosomal protein L27 [Candidatus Firestonebacteria bacterium RIFOXYC2_FULL_39_67]|nr:MAG: 50S ribosomal protein L27 [Candidatus Firestonebacteria bacterium RIFOXYD2_FULL_39_29]OGF52787.1 MAG: 50S ribosomal protein L27 [Candidatus Firestonebacteria bacterium RifOxyC12_full_39_7]OGF54877.1 MAG: 50S ribosomal protein L27 [Candidatus Firestonebacteria bacterium RIFOXYC2_FULL_39_67]
MASKKSGGTSRNGRDSQGQRMGVKAFGGEVVTGGSVIVRQRGSTFVAGVNAGEGSDHTIFAKISGVVKFTKNRVNIIAAEIQK